MQLSHQDKFFIFCLILLVACIIYISWNWSGTGYYVESYRPAVEQSQERRARVEEYNKRMEPKSREPRAPGFRESDIDKREGKRYRTF